jgi:5-methylthioadenosine/S-adenosylhomocysteine deaminase
MSGGARSPWIFSRPQRTPALLVAGCLLLATCAAAEGGATGDTSPVTILVSGGTVVTMDGPGTVIDDGAVAIAGSRIAAIGKAGELEALYPEARRLDATAGIIMPGLVNTHTHAAMVLFRGLADDLELMDWLDNHIFPAEAKFVDEEFVRWGTRLACLEMLLGGTTTFVDMYYFEEVVAEEADRCGIRAVVGETLIDFPAPDNKTWPEAIAYSRRFIERWRGNSRITPAVAPHAAYTVSADHLMAGHALAAELGVPLLIHVAEDRAEIARITAQTGMSSIDYLDGLGVLDDRVVAAHVVWPSPSEIERLAALGVGVAHCPQSNMKIAAGIAPVPAMLAAGVAVGLGTDGAASNNDLDLWEEIDTAAKLHKVIAANPTVIDAREALRMATIEGARALDMEGEIGSLEVGKRADLIVVSTDSPHQQPSYDPYSVLAYATGAADVAIVIIDGRPVVEDGRALTLDRDEIMRQARDYGRRIAASDAPSGSGDSTPE